MKILCRITKEELDDYINLMQNTDSLKTLFRIKKQKGGLTPEIEKEIKEKTLDINQKTSAWWEKITQSYNIPYYIDRAMLVDAQRLFIYVEE